eukprot:scaffold161980_cov40-Prasinocladus_malaysianus.AAC.1
MPRRNHRCIVRALYECEYERVACPALPTTDTFRRTVSTSCWCTSRLTCTGEFIPAWTGGSLPIICFAP